MSDDAAGRAPASVILAIRDCWQDTARCLTSVQATLGLQDEVVLVDDGSQPETAAAIAAVTGVVHVRHETPQGPASAYNAGAAAASRDVLVFLHSDTLVTPHWLDLLVAPLAEEGVVATGPRSNRAPAHQLINRLDEYSPETASDVWAFAATWRALNSGLRTKPRMLDSFCLAVRRDAFDAVQGFDSAFGFEAGEDIDLTLRLFTAGGELVIADEVFIHHVGAASQIAAGTDRNAAREAGFARIESRDLLGPARAWPAPTPAPEDADRLAVTVLIPTLNRPELLCRAVDSVRAQLWYGLSPDEVEIIVINDGGVPVRSALDAARAKARDNDRLQDVAVRVIEQPSTRGRAAALNAGLRTAAGRLIAPLDDDDVFLPQHLSMLMAEIAANGPGTAACSLSIQATEASDGEVGTRVQRVLPETLEPTRDVLRTSTAMRASTVVYPAEALRATGGWDENLLASEDWELHLRLSDSMEFRRVDVPTVETSFRGTENRSMRLYSRLQREMLDVFGQHPSVPGDWIDENREIIRSAVRARTDVYAYSATVAVLCRNDLRAAVKSLQSAGVLLSEQRWEVMLLVPSAAQYRELWQQFEGDMQMITVGHEGARKAWQQAEDLRSGRTLFTVIAGERLDAQVVREALEAAESNVVPAGQRSGSTAGAGRR
jgi:glycosyltransferase involved in cell wall biosynthesis